MANETRKSCESVGRGILKLALALVLVVVGVIVTVLAMGLGMRVPGEPIIQVGVGQFLGSLFAVLGVILLGGRHWLAPKGKAVIYTFRVAWVLLIVGALAIGASVSDLIASGQGVPDGVLTRFAGVALLCLGIGISEEFIYRGLILGGLLAVIGRSRVGVLAAVLISSIVFGFAHVSQTDFGEGVTSIQAVLKIVQTGMFGIVMCAAVLHTRNLWGAMVFHAVNDFLYLGVPALLTGVSSAGEYTMSGEGAIVGIGVYVFMIAVFLYPTVRGLMSIWREQEFCLGPFMGPRKGRGESLPQNAVAPAEPTKLDATS